QPFLDANRTYYDARVAALDFTAPTAVPTINAWVNEQTQGKIADIIAAIPGDVVMYLINAIYFKGDWMQQFDKKLTAPLPFHLQDGSTVNVPTMTYGTEATIRQTWTPSARIIELPYGGGAFSMTITDVLTKAYGDVNEEGTEAAAVTAVVVGVVCVCKPPPGRIDRPFVFALRENLSGTILFMGVIRHPPVS